MAGLRRDRAARGVIGPAHLDIADFAVLYVSDCRRPFQPRDKGKRACATVGGKCISATRGACA